MGPGGTAYGYLGPAGTFTEAALRNLLPPYCSVPHRPFPTVSAALDSVRRGNCVAAAVPMENSVRGVVPATLDQLVSEGLHITAEAELPVSFSLMSSPGTALDGVTRVLSHPHALAQCAGWLAERLPGAHAVPAGSTAAAAREVAEDQGLTTAAIAAPPAAELYGLRVLASGIGDRSEAVTRFVLVCPEWFPAPRTGLDRTSLVVSPGVGGPGTLAEILTVFSSRGVGLTWIQSWPTGDRLGSYRFFLDVEGHIEDPPVRDAVAALAAGGVRTRFLGSYPRTGAAPAPVYASAVS